MQDFSNARVSHLFHLAFFLILSITFASPAPAQEEKKAQPAQSGPAYVGPDACKTCHEDIYRGFEAGPHWKTTLDKRGGTVKQGCEGCHGPAGDHVDDPGDPSKIFSFKRASAQKINDRCLECHSSGKDHANFSRSAHSENNLSCLTCHSSHQGMKTQFLLTKAQPELC